MGNIRRYEDKGTKKNNVPSLLADSIPDFTIVFLQHYNISRFYFRPTLHWRKRQDLKSVQNRKRWSGLVTSGLTDLRCGFYLRAHYNCHLSILQHPLNSK